MSQEEPRSVEEKKLGDYRLRKILCENEYSTVWKAEQISMARSVVVEVLAQEVLTSPEVVTAFLENVRSKAVVEHAAIGSVYEAVETNETVYYVREEIAGQSLEELRKKGELLSTLQVLSLLEDIGGAINYLEENGFATDPLESGDIILGSHGAVRMVNRAVIGSPDGEVAWQDRDLLAGILIKLLDQGDVGSTRTGRLLGYLSERGEGAVSWMQVVHTAEKVKGDLELENKARAQEHGEGFQKKVILRALLGIAILAILTLVTGLVWRSGKKIEEPERERVLVHIAAGLYPGRVGEKVSVQEFWVESGEVTIADFSAFLDALQSISEESRDVYDHPEQPEQKINHEPLDWEALFAAAQVGGLWEGRETTLSTPVVNLDWWDAYAYANWAGGRLPTEKEWTSLRRGTMPGHSVWGPVTQSQEDLADGVYGLSGNVSEWTRDAEFNPMLPMQPKRPVICGGSYKLVAEGVHAREWLIDRNVRRPDLGFRVVYEKLPD